jgi:basic membrane lipoprotein Med (substrate-binding protein (PBP1-ABC) superfamily)
MQSASLATHAKVSYLAVSGPQTEENATTYLGSLVVQQCDVIIAAGAAEQAAVITDAGQFRSVRFAVVSTLAGPVAGLPPMSQSSRGIPLRSSRAWRA